jgi:hypothetical protein
MRGIELVDDGEKAMSFEERHGAKFHSSWKAKIPYWTSIVVAFGFVGGSIGYIVIDSILIALGVRFHPPASCAPPSHLGKFLITQGLLGLTASTCFLLARLFRRNPYLARIWWFSKTGTTVSLITGSVLVAQEHRSACNAVVYDWSKYYVWTCWGLLVLQVVLGIAGYLDSLRVLYVKWRISVRERELRRKRKEMSTRPKESALSSMVEEMQVGEERLNLVEDQQELEALLEAS